MIILKASNCNLSLVQGAIPWRRARREISEISSNPIPRAKDRRRTELSRMIPLNWLPSAHLPTYLPTFVLVYRRKERERERERERDEREKRDAENNSGYSKNEEQDEEWLTRCIFIRKCSDIGCRFYGDKVSTSLFKYHFSFHLKLFKNEFLSIIRYLELNERGDEF